MHTIMKNTAYPVLLCLFCLISFGCKDVLLYPTKGTISGIVTDNNGTPLTGITVSATYDELGQTPGQAPFPRTETTQTDHTGYFQLKDLWDEVLLTVQVPGFLPVTRRFELQDDNKVDIDLQLQGSPTVTAVSLSKPTISMSTPDSVTVSLEARDVYNQSSLPYQCNVLLVNGSQVTVAIVPASLLNQGFEHYLFEGLILSENITSGGNHSIVVEVQDPDGHTHRVDNGLSLQAQ